MTTRKKHKSASNAWYGKYNGGKARKKDTTMPSWFGIGRYDRG